MCKEEYRAAQERLLQQPGQRDMERHIFYWAQAGDKSLPHALLCRTMGDVARAPLDEILSLPGMGSKSMAMLIRLMRRAAEGETPSPPGKLTMVVTDHALNKTLTKFSPVWKRWCETIRRHGLEDEHLGRLVPCLGALPSNMWFNPLRDYLVDDPQLLRKRRGFGLQRLRVIMETFNAIDDLMGGSGATGSIDARLAPKIVRDAESWIRAALQNTDCPTAAELTDGLLDPLIAQLRQDLSETSADVAQARLDPAQLSASATQIARQLGLSRIRIYQLLDLCRQAMRVRWPDGSWFLGVLFTRCDQLGAEDDLLQRIRQAHDVFYGNADDEPDEPAQEQSPQG